MHDHISNHKFLLPWRITIAYEISCTTFRWVQITLAKMLCVGWSTGTVVSDLSRRVGQVVQRNTQNIDKTERCQNLDYSKIDKEFQCKITDMGIGAHSKQNNQNMANTEDEFYDRVVCQNEDIQDGQFKEVKLDEDGKVSGLLIKQNGQLSALSNKCTHYGANLATSGSLGEGVIRCPWHGACFNISSGDIEVKLYFVDRIHKLE